MSLVVRSLPVAWQGLLSGLHNHSAGSATATTVAESSEDPGEDKDDKKNNKDVLKTSCGKRIL